MIRIIIFNLVLVAVAFYAVRRGGGPERAVAVSMIVAAIASALVSLSTRANFEVVVVLLLVVDVLLFAVVAAIAVYANRFWPLWIAALQLDAIAIHIIKAYDREILPIIYAWSSGQIAYPMLLLLAWGTARHRKRVETSGLDRSWSI